VSHERLHDVARVAGGLDYRSHDRTPTEPVDERAFAAQARYWAGSRVVYDFQHIRAILRKLPPQIPAISLPE
jgi:hypothetical protein